MNANALRNWIGLATLCAVTSAANAADRPNVIYILADDLGIGDLGCYGQRHFETPHIDRLAEEGVRFTQHYSGSAVCAPSRSALLTGQHTGHTPIRGNAAVHPEGQQPMPADTRTVAHLFKDAGYATAIFGKWGLGGPGTASEPLRMGFDRFHGYNCQRHAHFYYPYYLWNDHQREMLWGNFGMERGDYAPDLIQEQLLAFVEAKREQPFFVYYAPVQPHAELAVPETELAPFRGRFGEETPYEGVDAGPNFRKHGYGSQAEPRATYAAMVSMLDRYVGELVAKLDALGLGDNTVIFFSSDNGPHREGGYDPAFFESAGPYRGIKRDLYEGGIRAPLIARWPGRIPAGATSDHLAAQWDMMPTFADLLGLPAPAETDGLSILPTLLGKPGQREHAFLYWEFHENNGCVAVRKGDWKAIRRQVALDPGGSIELYNLATDPGETTDVAARQPALVAEFDALLRNTRTVSPVARFNFPSQEPAAAGAEAAP
ncbi:MAG TPA: arylsulfatase [Kiritimatiellia bacterium]|nr:arylsulfatase [Kiritimatiellia bacterium]